MKSVKALDAEGRGTPGLYRIATPEASPNRYAPRGKSAAEIERDIAEDQAKRGNPGMDSS